MPTTERFEGRGKIYLASLSTSLALASGFLHVGDAELILKVETENREAMSLVDSVGSMTDRYITSVKSTAELNFREVNVENLALALLGTKVAVSSGTVGSGAPESFSNLTAGDIIPLRYMDVSSVAGVDSTGSPVTLTGTHFETHDAKAGLLKILSLSGLTQPLKFNYTYGAHTALPAINRDPVEYRLIAAVTNIGKRSERGRLIINRVQLNPPDEFAAIADKMAELKINGSILKDDNFTTDAQLGGFWSYRKI